MSKAAFSAKAFAIYLLIVGGVWTWFALKADARAFSPAVAVQT